MTIEALSSTEAHLSSEEEARAATYALLGALLYQPPDAALLQTLSSISPHQPTSQTPLESAWRRVSGIARRSSPEQLQREYQALFIGVGRGEVVPYASKYLSGFLMEQPLADLRQDLIRLGFTRNDEVREPEDHAAAICEVMVMLIRSPEYVRDEEKQFFERHVNSWMGRFFSDLANSDTGEFYRAVGDLGRSFLDVESRYFQMLA